jgi:hypothetical protein
VGVADYELDALADFLAARAGERTAGVVDPSTAVSILTTAHREGLSPAVTALEMQRVALPFADHPDYRAAWAPGSGLPPPPPSAIQVRSDSDRLVLDGAPSSDG